MCSQRFCHCEVFSLSRHCEGTVVARGNLRALTVLSLRASEEVEAISESRLPCLPDPSLRGSFCEPKQSLFAFPHSRLYGSQVPEIATSPKIRAPRNDRWGSLRGLGEVEAISFLRLPISLKHQRLLRQDKKRPSSQ